nr:hypothetical protein [Tanacetum cinerariifolium]
MMSEDLSTTGTDNRPPMLEESDYESWKIRKVNQEHALVNATLSAELDQCKLELARLERNKVKLECDQKTLKDKYLEEIDCLKNANQVPTGLLQKFQMPTQTIPMLSKRPMIASNDIHKIGLGLSNPWFGRKAQLSQPTLYDGHRLLQPGHAPVTVSDSHETLFKTE